MTGLGTLDDGFHEACAIVRDVDDTAARLCRVFGYTVIWRGDADRGALNLLGVPGDVTGVEALVGDTAQGRGYIRLFSFPDHAAGVMRDGAQAWDTGGIFDVNIRSLGPIEPLHHAMTLNGFSAFAPVTAWTFGAIAVKEVVENDADGLAIAMMQRVSPPLQGFEHVGGHASYVFNSTQVVPSFAAARALYVDALGWTPVQELHSVHEDGLNCMGLPLDVARIRQMSIGIYQAKGGMRGSVEIIEYTGEALDFSAAAPPDRGWTALRFPVSDLDGFASAAAQGGCTVTSPRPIMMQPYGAAVACTAITPWGARLQAYMPVSV